MKSEVLTTGSCANSNITLNQKSVRRRRYRRIAGTDGLIAVNAELAGRISGHATNFYARGVIANS